ncbi:MAG: RyR domain [Actinomycetia bacterium]|nr:RyR domain [Actinomycetes bacterium]
MRTLRYSPATSARVWYAAVRQLQEEHGLLPGPEWHLLVPEERCWYVRHAERALLGMLPREVHGAWRADLTGDPDPSARWQPGPEADHVKRTHPDLERWDDLPGDARSRFRLLQLIAVGLHVVLPDPVGGSSRIAVT